VDGLINYSHDAGLRDDDSFAGGARPKIVQRSVRLDGIGKANRPISAQQSPLLVSCTHQCPPALLAKSPQSSSDASGM
jgi:hypothetical protein